MGLIGREREISAIGALIGGVPHRGGALVIRGATGSGKSALLREAVGSARTSGLRVLEVGEATRSREAGYEAGCTEGRLPLPLSGLRRLLEPVAEPSHELFGEQRAPEPAPHAAAGTFWDPSTGVAALRLLNRAAAPRPILVAVDDAQRLDRPTQEALAFIARRCDAEPIAVVIAVDEDHQGALVSAGLPEVILDPLDDDAAHHVLAACAADLGTAAHERIARHAAGNPLALVELAAARRQAHRRPESAGAPASLPLTARLTAAFGAGLADLPQSVRDAVLVAAVYEEDGLPEILAAGSVLAGRPVTVDDLEVPGLSRLIGFDGVRLRFRHPLVRYAVLHSEPADRRRAAHAALADVLQEEPRQRLWHRAQAVTGTDEELADRLESGCTKSLRLGPVVEAVRVLERAAELSADSGGRGRRLLLACEQAFGLGRVEWAEYLLGETAGTALSDADRARRQWLRDTVGDQGTGRRDRVLGLCDDAERVYAAGDRDLALNLLLGAALLCWWSESGPAARVRSSAHVLAGTGADPRRIAAIALAEPVRGAAAVTELLAQAHFTDDGEELSLLGMAAHAVGDLPRAVDLFCRAEPRLREQGLLGVLSQVMAMRTADRLLLGEWRQATQAAEESRRLAERGGRPRWAGSAMSTDALAHALRGQWEDALRLADTAELAPRATAAPARLARGVALTNAGRHAEAYEVLRSLFEPAGTGHRLRTSLGGLMFYADAAERSGHLCEARRTVAALERTALTTTSPLLHVQVRYARAVLADHADAESRYLDALATDLSRWPLVRAKLELAYGSWLRRRRRAAEARVPLNSSLVTLDLIGAAPWAEQARSELRAAGERGAANGPVAPDVLSEQDVEIALLAARGLSNREIGAQLHLSPRTIGSRLYRLFPKLGVSARSQLSATLDLLPDIERQDVHQGDRRETPAGHRMVSAG
ncbi:LuxR family transcriptional regulator [Streptomyces sp. NBC_01136]|uniref:helix-turn-helix transcriptional regulator n=1 Tax=unclassified Streptomyces TaxID=2593676 RepID=UPI00324B4FEB|nr:LuxR family transcriptional regulator [Streptomyces sp. NBC_01136]